MTPTAEQDPGWRRPILIGTFGFLIVLLLLPRGGLRFRDGLVALRTLWVAYFTTDLGFAAVGAWLGPSFRGSVPAIAAAAGVLIFAGAAVVLRARVLPDRSPWAADLTPAAVAGRFRSRWFLEAALAGMIAVVGFTGTALSASVIPVVIGVAVALIGLTRINPGAGHLRDRQEELRRAGSTVRLVPALQDLPFGPRRRGSGR